MCHITSILSIAHPVLRLKPRSHSLFERRVQAREASSDKALPLPTFSTATRRRSWCVSDGCCCNGDGNNVQLQEGGFGGELPTGAGLEMMGRLRWQGWAEERPDERDVKAGLPPSPKCRVWNLSRWPYESWVTVVKALMRSRDRKCTKPSVYSHQAH